MESTITRATAPDLSDTSTGDLVRAAAASDAEAWKALVERFGGLVWAIARSHRLDRTDAADVSQTVWLRLVDHLDRLREPDRAGAWLAATTRHECLRVIRAHQRTVPTDDSQIFDAAGTVGDPGGSADPLADRERDAAVWAMVGTLPPRSQALVRMLMADPPATYTEISAGLGIPIGSIGPTRQRCLRLLRAKCSLAGIEF